MVRLKDFFVDLLDGWFDIFQFLNGAIKSSDLSGTFVNYSGFQFLNGAIKSINSHSMKQILLYFNSSMVRLKGRCPWLSYQRF